MKNHYIPQTYLRRWADPTTGKLCQHQCIRGRVVAKAVHPSETGFEHDTYTLHDLAADKRHFVETVLFKRVDQDAANGLDLFLADDINAGVTGDLITGWSRFLMSLLHRQPARIESLKVAAREQFSTVIPDLRAGWGQHPDHETLTFDDYLERNAPALIAVCFANVLGKICNSANIGQHMNNMIKSVATIQGSKRFLTCDNPLTLFKPLDGDGSYILLPISPKKIFIAANRQAIVDRLFERLRDEDLVEQLNEAAISNAYLYVYDTHMDQTGLVNRYFIR